MRRRMPLDELDPERDEHTAAALTALVDSRLVTADEETLEVAHEALLREWPRLRGWLEEDAEGRRLHQHLIHAARDWQAAGRDRGELYRGARLASALDWSAGHEGDLNELERDFLDESRAAAERDAERQRRANRRLRTLLAGLAALLALAIVAGVVALNQRGEARDAAVTADAQRLGVEALGTERVDEAVLLDPRGRGARRIPRHPRHAAVGAPSRAGGDRLRQPRLADIRRGPEPGREVDGHRRRGRRRHRLRRRHPAPARPALSDRRRSHPERSFLAGRQNACGQLDGPEGPQSQRDRRPDRCAYPRADAAGEVAPAPRAGTFRVRGRRVRAGGSRPRRSAGPRRRAGRPRAARVSRRREDGSGQGSPPCGAIPA